MQGSRFIEQDMVKAIFYLEVAAEAGNVAASGKDSQSQSYPSYPNLLSLALAL
jgi:hypothetical protein